MERAHFLTLTAPEMTVLFGGLRVLGANFGHSQLGIFTKRPESLTNDFFVNLLDMDTEWRKSAKSDDIYEGLQVGTGQLKWTATAADLVFGSNSHLRAISEFYGCSDSTAGVRA